MKKSMTLMVILGLLSQCADRALAAVTIPAGTSVMVKTTQVVSSATQKKGDVVSMEAAADVMVDGQKVIAVGAPATATVMNASKRFIAGIGGQLDIQVDKVQAVDGSWVPLKYVKGEHSGSSLTSIVLTVICCICFVFIPGKDVSVDKGTIFEATVSAPTSVK